MRNFKFVILSLLAFIFLSFSGDGDGLKFYSWNEGYPIGMQKNKIILVDVYTDWCGWCKKMDRDTYAKEEIIKIINENFVPIKFNPELDKTYKIDNQEVNGRQLLQIISQGRHSGYPTIYFLFPEERVIYAESGYQGPDQFKQTLKKYLTLREEGKIPDKSKSAN